MCKLELISLIDLCPTKGPHRLSQLGVLKLPEGTAQGSHAEHPGPGRPRFPGLRDSPLQLLLECVRKTTAPVMLHRNRWPV